MSSSFAKAKLKLAREAIGKKDFATVKSLADDVLEHEPTNYHALVFSGLANLSLKKFEASEAAYLKATAQSPELPTAWQGLAAFYESQHGWSELAGVYSHLIEIFAKAEDAVKLAETIQKLLELRREEGPRSQLIQTLHLLLPSSPFWPILQTLPAPTPTEPTSTTTQYVQTIVHGDDLPVLQEIVRLQEEEEAQLREKEVEKRRLRLGTKPQTKKQVQAAVFAEMGVQSQLPMLYSSLMNHPNLPTEALRETEHKLFLFHYSLLVALPPSADAKPIARKEVKDIARGVVLLGQADQEIWDVELEWEDYVSFQQYPLSTLKKYASLFPEAARATFIRGYLKYFGLQDPPEEEEESSEKRTTRQRKNKDVAAAASVEVGVDEQNAAWQLLLDGSDALPSSLLCHRILAQIHLLEHDYVSAIQTATEGLDILLVMEREIGLSYSNSRLAFQTILATSYVHHFSPKHHPLAAPLLDTVLAARPEDSQALTGRGYVLEAKEVWDEAEEMFARAEVVLARDGKGAVWDLAREEKAWCAFKAGKKDEGREALKAILSSLAENSVDPAILAQGARVAWKLGTCYWEMGGQENRDIAHQLYLGSLRRSSTYAPSWTAIGIFCAELHPPDDVRASKCFQRAFELDPREGEAGRRLADHFADAREWELVEIIAKRTIEGEGGLEGGLATAVDERVKEAKGRFLVGNVWAWKALGAVELTRSAFAKAINHFQIALRSDSIDIASWLRLSEAYARSGKQAAALKTLARARAIDPDNWLVTFMIGDVQTQLGVHTEAIRCFREILKTRPKELGVLVALARSHLALAREEASAGYHARSEGSLIQSLASVQAILVEKVGFRALAWKHVGDVCLDLARLSFQFDVDMVAKALIPFVKILVAEDPSGHSSVDCVATARQLLSPKPEIDIAFVLRLATCAFTYRRHLLVGDEIASAVASHDIAIALHHLGTDAPTLLETVRQACVKEATAAIRSALRAQPRNEHLWITLGTLSFESSAKLSQHAFVMALEINPKNPIVWSNLGFLYLKHDDYKLAEEAFYKAQILDPDCALAWLGLGIIATVEGNQHSDARLIFQHAVDLSEDSLLEANLSFALATYELFATSTPPSASILHAPAFALKRFCEQRPQDATALHLYALIAERLGQYDLALGQLTKAVSVLEAAYEVSEDVEVEAKFAIAQSNLGRLRLASGEYQLAVEAFAGTLGLIDAADDSVQSRRVRVHAKFGSGLAHYWLGELDESLSMFQAALDELETKPMGRMKDQVSVLLAQALWAMGGEEEKDAAKNTLLECITADSTNLDAVATLAAIGTVSADRELVEAALSEVFALPAARRHKLDPNGDLAWLQAHAALAESDAASAEAAFSKAAEEFPTDAARPLLDLARLRLQQHDASGSSTHVQAARKAASFDPLGEPAWEALIVGSIAASREGIGAEALKAAQRALMMRPWEERAWLAVELAKGAPRKAQVVEKTIEEGEGENEFGRKA